MNSSYLLTCNYASFHTPQLLLHVKSNKSPFEITSITSDTITILSTQISRECYPPLPDPNENFATLDLGNDLPYTISTSRNKLTAVGCDTTGMFFPADDSYMGCFSFCSNTTVLFDGTCSGEGCCQANLKKGLKSLTASVFSTYNHSLNRNMSNCSASFVVEKDWYNFTTADVIDFTRTEVPVVLDWAVGEEICAVANKSTGFACVGGRGKTRCVDSESGSGYRCYCVDGYEGNPYLPDGCQDIDECRNATANVCSDICTNTLGSFTCSCPPGQYGDGLSSGKRCSKDNPNFPLAAQITLAVGLGIMALLLSSSCIYWVRRKRKYILLKESYFEKNGGMLLRQQMSKDGNGARIFGEDELKVATNGFSESRVLGSGGNGTVYKGFLPDNRVVAIKKSKVVEQTQMHQFINEIAMLSKVIHKNVVKILGCCLETQVPLLVYEYIPNGTLSDHIHPESGTPSMLSWERRLRIAAETAGAIAYLHSDLETPIIHRDIKSANKLLDDHFMAKVADFGASRLAPLDGEEVATMVQGTLGYLDPEYFQTGHLTDKSDVYSFGVVLVELLTGEKSISFTRAVDVRNLAIHFLSTMKEERLDILEMKIRAEADREQVMAFAEIARSCLEVKGEERPTMKEVAAELDKLGNCRGRPVNVDGHADHHRSYTNRGVQWNASPLNIEDSVDGHDENLDWSVNLQR